jgi:hypothetical protein
MNRLKKLRATLKSKTALTAYVVMLLGVADQITPFIAGLVPPEYNGLVVAGLGLVFWFLRWITNTALDEK